MALFDKLRNSGTLSLRGNNGPTFENEGQRASSTIQALTNHNTLIESQDLRTGRTYGNSPNRIRVSPSKLNLNGTTNSNWLKPEETSVRAENTINNQNAIKLIKIDRTNLPELQEEIVDLNNKQEKKISWGQENEMPSSFFSKLKMINSEEDKIDKINERLDKLEKIILQLLDQNKPNSHYS
jgi:hypothetical protein